MRSIDAEKAGELGVRLLRQMAHLEFSEQVTLLGLMVVFAISEQFEGQDDRLRWFDKWAAITRDVINLEVDDV